MHRMAELVGADQGLLLKSPEEGEDRADGALSDVQVYRLRGPLFFGAASGLGELLVGLLASGRPLPREFQLEMSEVPLIDASGVGVLRDFIERCKGLKVAVSLKNVQTQPAKVLKAMGLEV
jgi:SulP family sulfate permease